MMIDQDVQRAAATFWAAAGEDEAFPRQLDDAILWALPLTVVKLPRLRVRDALGWLERRRIYRPLCGEDRPLHACLIAHAGEGFLFLDGADSPNERRFSLAHETAHFLCDYWGPRHRAIARLGIGILEVLDGQRQATVDERVAAVLAGAHVGAHSHLMEREANGQLGCRSAINAEERADRLALELLAPATEVLARLGILGRPPTISTAETTTTSLLLTEFGLPETIAVSYGTMLAHRWYRGATVREWLGI